MSSSFFVSTFNFSHQTSAISLQPSALLIITPDVPSFILVGHGIIYCILLVECCTRFSKRSSNGLYLRCLYSICNRSNICLFHRLFLLSLLLNVLFTIHNVQALCRLHNTTTAQVIDSLVKDFVNIKIFYFCFFIIKFG